MNIFFLYTPLHTLISSKIIKENNINDYVLIFIGRNEKDALYFNKFAVSASKSYYFEKRNLAILTLKIFFLSFRLVENKRFCFYTGHPKSILTRIFLLFKKFEFYTMDDGFGNINPDPKSYFRLNNENICTALLFGVFDKKLLYYNLKKSIIIHYTIFKQQNVFNNCQYIKLIDKVDLDVKKLKTINVFLSSDFTESGIKNLIFEKSVYELVIKKYQIDVIIEHPASKLIKFEQKYNHKIYKGYLIAEDYIIELSKDALVRLFGFQCTTLFVFENFSDNIVVCDLGNYSKYI